MAIQIPVLSIGQRDLFPIVKFGNDKILVELDISLRQFVVAWMRIDDRPYLLQKPYLLTSKAGPSSSGSL